MTRFLLTATGLLLTIVLALNHSTLEFKFEWLRGADAVPYRVKLPLVDALERNAYDVRVQLSASDERDGRIVIIDVDDQSLQVEGQWPWPRALFAKLVDRLYDNYQIDTLGFDVTFPEPEDIYTDSRIEQLVKVSENPQELLAKLRSQSGDVLFAKSFEGRSVVLGSVFQAPLLGQALNPSFGQLPLPAFQDADISLARILDETDAPLAYRHTSNLGSLADSAAATGFFSISQKVGDPDGITRRVELLNKFDSKLYSSFALQLVQTFFLDAAQPILVDNQFDEYLGLEGLSLVHADIPLDQQASVYVPYAKQGAAYEYIPATDILTGKYQGNIAGAIAIVGTSAAGLVDLRNSPVGASLPGVEIHANVVSALLDGNFRKRPSWTTAADFIQLTLLGVLLSVLLPRLSALAGTVTVFLIYTATVWVNWYFWVDKGLILSIAPLLLLIGSIYLLNMVIGFFAETAARKTTQKMFGLYVPPEVVDEMSVDTNAFSLKSEKREMTVMFADIRNFTNISESMEPEVLSQWLNSFLTPMTQIIHKNGGAIDKYMGDSIMAFWGAPLNDSQHAKHAVEASIEMVSYLETLNAQIRKRDQPEIDMGIGINTGMMSVGNMGSEFRMAYTVLGDAVNLGSRLESLTKEYKVSMIVSEFTRAAAPDFHYERLDRVKVKGKDDAVTIYQCVVD